MGRVGGEDTALHPLPFRPHLNVPKKKKKTRPHRHVASRKPKKKKNDCDGPRLATHRRSGSWDSMVVFCTRCLPIPRPEGDGPPRIDTVEGEEAVAHVTVPWRK